MASGESPPKKKQRIDKKGIEYEAAVGPASADAELQLTDAEQKDELLKYLQKAMSISTANRPSSSTRKGNHFTADEIFIELVKVAKGWRWVAEEILLISTSTCENLMKSGVDDDSRLKLAIKHWMIHSAFPSWHYLIYQFESKNEKAIVKMMRALAEPADKIRLTTNNAFHVLSKINKGWRWVTENILLISKQKSDAFEGEKDTLKAAIVFWMKRCVFASWRFIIYRLFIANEIIIAMDILYLAEPITESTMTVENVLSALESVSNDDFAEAIDMPLGDLEHQKGGGNIFKEKLIEYGLNYHPTPTWEFLSGKLYMHEHKLAVKEVEKYFKRDLDPFLTHENLKEALKDVKDWSIDVNGFPWCIDIPASKRNEIQNKYPLAEDLPRRQSEFLKHWLETFPYPCWERICYALYWQQEYDVLESIQNKYFGGTYEARRHFKEAMKKGKTTTDIAKVVLFGAVGSGKTCTKHVILDEDPPQEHTSTPLAVRPVKIYCINALNAMWRTLTIYQRDLLISGACYLQGIRELHGNQHVSPVVIRGTESLYATEQNKASQVLPLSDLTTDSVEAANVNKDTFLDNVKHSFQVATSESYQYILECAAEMSEFMTVQLKRVQITDCGGQPPFHEVLPIFLRGPTLYLFVLKLNETLNTCPTVNYYSNGEAMIPISYTSGVSIEQLLEHCLRVVRSQKALAKNAALQTNVTMSPQSNKSKASEFPKIMIIGTHKDRENECKAESREEKNKKIIQLLHREFMKDVRFYCTEKNNLQPLFPLNAKNPGTAEKIVAAKIRNLVSDECSLTVEIPLQYHALEVLLEKLANTLKRDVLSKDECLTAAQSLQFDDEGALDAALDYLHRLNLVFYYPEILPSVIFVNSQVLLNIVTDLVILFESEGQTAVDTKSLPAYSSIRFNNYALVSEEFAQEYLQKHFVPPIFIHCDLITLFRKLLIFADYSNEEYLVPALLKRISNEDLHKYRPVSLASPLVLSFSEHGGPLLGVFCASVCALLSEDTNPRPWKLSKSRSLVAPKCLYRNCVEFEIPNDSIFVTMIETFECIEIHAEIQASCSSRSDDRIHNRCQRIRHAVMKALQRATTTLHYEFKNPKLGFRCPCGDPIFHHATISRDVDLWICTKNPRMCGDLESNQIFWLNQSERNVNEECIENAQKSESLESNQFCDSSRNKVLILPQTSKCIPKTHELDLLEHKGNKIRIIDCIAARWEAVATRLYFESCTTQAIWRDSNHQTEAACRIMFGKWLEGEGRKPKSWHTLIQALEEAKFSTLAQQIQDIFQS